MLFVYKLTTVLFRAAVEINNFHTITMIVKPLLCRCLLVQCSPFKFGFRLRHKLKNVDKPPAKASSEVVKYLETQPEYAELKDHMPKSLLRKFKAPESMYLINRKTAKDIANTIRDYLEPQLPVIEVNPGFGFLSEELLQLPLDHIYMYEISNNFSPYKNVSYCLNESAWYELEKNALLRKVLPVPNSDFSDRIWQSELVK